MLIILLRHKNGGREMKVKLCVSLTSTQTRFSFAVFSKVAMVTPAAPRPRFGGTNVRSV